MANAVEEFFPESGILDNSEAVFEKAELSRVESRKLGERPSPLRRVETGISSIVGPGNGDRPGGFVLVIDGSALGYVSARIEHDNRMILIFGAGSCR